MHKPMRKLFVVLGLLAVSGPVLAEDYDELDDRLRAIEGRMPAASGTTSPGSTGMLGMVDDLQRLQEEVRRLRGDVERLQYDAEQNRVRQRDMFIDIEKRLTALEQGGTRPLAAAPAIVPPATPAPATAIPQAGANTASAPQPAAPAGTTVAPPVTSPPPIAAPPAPQANPADEQAAYLQAFEMLKQGRYDESITAFQGFLQRYPNGDYADNGHYWLAETYYVKKNYTAALKEFQTLLASYPNSSKLPGALLKVGYIQYELGANAEARLALERVRNEFSASSVADLARQRLERMDREGR